MITAENISKTFTNGSKKINISNIIFYVKKGDIVGLLGQNGAGKASLLKLILGISEPTYGKIWVMGKNPSLICKLPCKMNNDLRKEIGILFFRSLPYSETVSNYLSVNYRKSNTAEFTEFIKFASAELQIDRLMTYDMRSLSTGERTRVDFFKSIMCNPTLLILYEPTTGVDAFMKEKISDILLEMNKKFGTTILVASQDVSQAEKICHKAIILDKGQIIYFGNFDELRKRYILKDRITFVMEKGFPDLQDLPVIKISATENNLTVEYRKDLVSTMEIVQRVIGSCNVKEMKISEPNIESVLKNIYYSEKEDEHNDE